MKGKIIDLNERLVKGFLEKRRLKNPEIHKLLYLGYSWDGSAFILFQVHLAWDNLEEHQEICFAKIRYYKSRSQWCLYWMRDNGKWEAYDPHPVSTHLQQLLEVIEEDSLGYFFG